MHIITKDKTVWDERNIRLITEYMRIRRIDRIKSKTYIPLWKVDNVHNSWTSAEYNRKPRLAQT